MQYTPAKTKSADHGKIALLSHLDRQPMLGLVEDLTSAAGVNVSTFRLDAVGFPVPVIVIEDQREPVRVTITEETPAMFLADEKRDGLAKAYVRYCANRGLPFEQTLMLNVVHYLPQAGVETVTEENRAVAENWIAQIRSAYFRGVEKLIR